MTLTFQPVPEPHGECSPSKRFKIPTPLLFGGLVGCHTWRGGPWTPRQWWRQRESRIIKSCMHRGQDPRWVEGVGEHLPPAPQRPAPLEVEIWLSVPRISGLPAPPSCLGGLAWPCPHHGQGLSTGGPQTHNLWGGCPSLSISLLVLASQRAGRASESRVPHPDGACRNRGQSNSASQLSSAACPTHRGSPRRWWLWPVLPLS